MINKYNFHIGKSSHLKEKSLLTAWTEWLMKCMGKVVGASGLHELPVWQMYVTNLSSDCCTMVQQKMC